MHRHQQKCCAECCFSDKLAHWMTFEISVCSPVRGARAALPCFSGITVIKQQNVTQPLGGERRRVQLIAGASRLCRVSWQKEMQIPFP